MIGRVSSSIRRSTCVSNGHKQCEAGSASADPWCMPLRLLLSHRSPLLVSLRCRSLPSCTDCIATIYGPITSQGTGILAYANSTTKLASFRISATGVILELDHQFKIVKKLKLTGYPYKIYKNVRRIERDAIDARFCGCRPM
jgi:hypothetical protein